MFKIVSPFSMVIVLIFSAVTIASEMEPPKGYRSETTLKMAYFFGTLKLIETHIDVPKNVIESRDVEYNRIGDTSLKLDIYRPRVFAEPAPLLVFIHGGAWKKGDKSDYQRYLVEFAERGYVTASVQYRFSQQAVFPAQVSDAKCAVRWLKSNAEEYGIDRNNIAVIGGSAGGHLAMMVAYSPGVNALEGECDGIEESSQVQAVVNLYGPADLTTGRSVVTPSVIQLLGPKPSENAHALASPITYIGQNSPPTLIFHGTLDSLVPVSQSEKLKARLTAEGVAVDFHKLKGWPHTMDMGRDVNAYVQHYMWQFFRQTLQGESSSGL